MPYHKRQVKELSSAFGISVASRPSTPCMATRLPYGTKLDYEILRRIEKGEAYLRIRDVRLRLHQDTVRLERHPAQMADSLGKEGGNLQRFEKLGFSYVTLDLERNPSKSSVI